MWSTPDQRAGDSVQLVVRRTKDAEAAAHWRSELSAGRLPEESTNVP